MCGNADQKHILFDFDPEIHNPERNAKPKCIFASNARAKLFARQLRNLWQLGSKELADGLVVLPVATACCDTAVGQTFSFGFGCRPRASGSCTETP